jgi:putative acetyltransferase
MRQATRADLPAMAAAHIDSIRSLGSAYYAADLVEAWAAAVRPQMYLDAMRDGEVFFIAVGSTSEGPVVLGFSSHRPETGDDGISVYVRGDCARRGLGTALLQLAEAHAVSAGAAALTIHASLGAVHFYAANGFEEAGQGTARLHTGASMPCVVMRKRLTAASR